MVGEKPTPHCGKLFHPISDFFAAPVLVYIFHIFGMLFGIIFDHQPSCHGGMALPVPLSKACLGGVRATLLLCSTILDVLRVWLCVSGEICCLMSINGP